MNAETESIIASLAKQDPSNAVRQEAIDAIGALSKPIYKSQFMEWCNDSSYSVAGAALEALEKVDSAAAIDIATKESKKVIKKRLNSAVTSILSKYGDESVFEFVAKKYESLNIQSEEKFYMTQPFADLLIKTTDATKFKKGIELIVGFRDAIPEGYKTQTNPYFNMRILGEILKAKKQKGEDNLVKIVSEVLPKM
jgi:aminopeptidase N